ncbi:NAD(P)/FAD-dependent oxidoreductase [Desulfovibrio psychrotolerans]|uniref:Pyridine nucleotide-disulfide oxidoreductase n=1 Tax=Desulfovibrio psychrotolerans TaxID=415242 RepID=A0A7J0BP29_9BACT|nr:FAD-dependent oxidoreductase [Desulfovibrio psychrotolerans]GFM35409.1 pyridine nucleotide-disulfide oxidoreductase [Desulfovibrio psychrotolerans]
MTYVIVGNGVASVGAIEGIRKVDKEGRILVVSEEQTPTYGRPLISYFLAGKIGLDRMSLRPDDFYDRNNVELKLGARVTGLNPDGKTITLADGSTIAYDSLLLATGGIPFMPPIKGLAGPDIYNFTTLAHAEELITLSQSIRKVVVIGGGLIGLKAAEGLFDNGLSVTIVELAPRVLSAAFDDVAGGMVSRRLEHEGLHIRCGNTVEEILRDAEYSRVIGVRLTNGEELECEAVVVAIGVVPSLTPAKEAGLQVKRGIKVDDYLRTSATDVYAAGDVAEAYDMIADDARVTPIWPNAYSQGYYAGLNMTGKKSEKHPGGLAMNAISFYGLATASLGLVNPAPEDGCDVFTFVDEEEQSYRKLVFRNDKLVGYVLVGDIDFAGLYTGFVRFQLPLTDEVKQDLKDGRPSALLWPEHDFETRWTPECE